MGQLLICVQSHPSRVKSYVAAYCAAKGAIEAYTRAVAVHCGLKKNGVRCNSIHPSGIITPMVESVPEKMEVKFVEHLIRCSS